MQRLFAAALGSAALAFAGCGGDDDSSGGSGSSSAGGSSDATLTKAEYITKADDICRDNQKQIDPIEAEIDDLPKDSQGRGEPKDIAPILERALTVTRAGFARLKELPVPAEDKATVDRWLASNEEAFDALEELQVAVAANDRKAAEEPGGKIDSLSDEQRTLARKYGFKACLSAASTD